MEFFFNTRFNICLKLTNPAGNSQVWFFFFFPIQIHSWFSLGMQVWVTVTWQQGVIWVVGRAIPEPQSAPRTIPPEKPEGKVGRAWDAGEGSWSQHPPAAGSSLLPRAAI